MNIRSLFSAAIAIAAFATPALSADLPVKKLNQAAAPVYIDPWSGFYIGIDAGYGVNTTNQNAFLTNGAQVQSLINSLPGSPQGFTGGLFMGIGQHCLGFLYCGLETDIQAAAFNSTTVSGALAGLSTQTSQKQTWFGTTRARFGVPLGNVMPFVSAGVAYGDAEDTFTFQDVATGQVASTQAHGTKMGWSWGGGLEGALGDGWKLRAEYLRVDLGKISTTSPIATGVLLSANASWQADIFRLGVSKGFSF